MMAGSGVFARIATAQPPKDADGSSTRPAIQATSKGGGGRGATQRVASEINESKDPETGARVRRLTADGSDDVHIYFTSEVLCRRRIG